MDNGKDGTAQVDTQVPLIPGPKELELRAEVRPGLYARAASGCRRTGRQVCSREFLKARLPPLSWAGDYSLQMLTGDIIAGVTTALTVIPQGIGYAPLAGLPLQYGLYASLVPGFTYCLLGTTRQTTIGPTAVNSLMSFNYAGGSPYKAVTLAFFAGVIEILCGLFNLGFLIQFISQPVIAAFSSAVSIQVITSQVKGFFGITGFQGRGFVNVWVGMFTNITTIQWYDTAVGLACMMILYFLRRLKEFKWCEGQNPDTDRARIVKKSKWLLSISANCLVVVVTSVVAWVLVSQGIDLINLTGSVDPGLPSWQLPWLFNRNTTDPGEWEGPVELAQELGIGLLMLPLVSILQHLAIAKHYAGNRKMAASQEMLALGVSQLVGSFTGSMAVTASFGRSAVNSTSGVRTPFGGVITGLILIMACAFLSPHLAFIPTASLSAVIIFSMFFTIDYAMPRALWNSKRMDLIPYTLTFVLGLFWNVESGLIVGSLVHLGLLLFSQARPLILLQPADSHTLVSLQCSNLSFPGVEHLRDRLAAAESGQKAIVLDLALVQSVDYTSAKTFCGIVKGQRERGVSVELCCIRPGVLATLEAVHGGALDQAQSVEDAVKLILV